MVNCSCIHRIDRVKDIVDCSAIFFTLLPQLEALEVLRISLFCKLNDKQTSLLRASPHFCSFRTVRIKTLFSNCQWCRRWSRFAYLGAIRGFSSSERKNNTDRQRNQFQKTALFPRIMQYSTEPKKNSDPQIFKNILLSILMMIFSIKTRKILPPVVGGLVVFFVKLDSKTTTPIVVISPWNWAMT